MNKNLAIPTAFLLIAGAVAIVVLKKDDAEDPKTADSSKPKEEQSVSGRPSGSRASGLSGGSPRQISPRTGQTSRQGELVKKYGQARTARAREVSQNMVGILDDVIAVGELMVKGGQQMGIGRRGMVGGITRRMGIELNEEQQDKALALYDEWQKGELEKSKKAASDLRDDPTAVMELFLAGDAKERGEMDEDDYLAVRDNAVGELANIINPLDRENFRGDRRMASDEKLMSQFAEILDPEQAEKFSAYREAEAAEAAEKPKRDGNITSMPTMELEKLDGAIGSAKKMTTGFRSIMEGMGGLQNLRPPNEGGE